MVVAILVLVVVLVLWLCLCQRRCRCGEYGCRFGCGRGYRCRTGVSGRERISFRGSGIDAHGGIGNGIGVGVGVGIGIDIDIDIDIRFSEQYVSVARLGVLNQSRSYNRYQIPGI